MAITSVKEIGEGRGATERAHTKANTRVFRVISDAVITGDLAALKTATDGVTAIPTLYTSTYPNDATLTVSGVDVQPVDETYEIFEVRVSYEQEPVGGWWTSPTSREWVWSVTSMDQSYVPRTAKNVNPVDRWYNKAQQALGADVDPQVNSAGEYWQEPYQDTRQVLVISLKKAILVPPAISQLREYQGSVNDANIQILGETFQARELLMSTYESPGKSVDTNGNDYYNINYKLIVAPVNNDGTRGNWDVYLLDQGMNQDKDGKRLTCGDKLNTRPVKPIKLDGKGIQLADQDGAGVYLGNRIKKEKDFSIFTFPGTYP